MKEHLEAAEKQRVTGEISTANGRLTFGEATAIYRKELAVTEVRPNTKFYREAGVKLVLRSWERINELNVRRITSKMVEAWLRRFKANAKPHNPIAFQVDDVRGSDSCEAWKRFRNAR